jgi:outer membrane receptor protein involved in Fe transport
MGSLGERALRRTGRNGPGTQFLTQGASPQHRRGRTASGGWTPCLSRFGEITLIDWLDTEDVYRAKTVADASLTYRISSNASLTVGGTNLLNAYPSQQYTETETGGLWDAVQMGASGASYFARLNFKL